MVEGWKGWLGGRERRGFRHFSLSLRRRSLSEVVEGRIWKGGRVVCEREGKA